MPSHAKLVVSRATLFDPVRLELGYKCADLSYSWRRRINMSGTYLLIFLTTACDLGSGAYDAGRIDL